MAGTIYSKFFWSDWMSDMGVRTSSYAARGLWMDLLCIASQEKGFVKINGRYPDAAEIAKITNGTVSEVETLLAELEANGVFSRDRNGHIYCRRMVKYEKNRQNGRLGGNPMLLALQPNPFSDNHLPKAQRPLTTNQTPKKKVSVSQNCVLPETWNPTERHYKTGQKRGLSIEQVNGMAIDMREWSVSGGKKKANWDIFFNIWMKNNYSGGVRNGYGTKRNGPAGVRSAIYETLDRAIEATGGYQLRGQESTGVNGSGKTVGKSGPDTLSAWPSGSPLALPKAGD